MATSIALHNDKVFMSKVMEIKRLTYEYKMWQWQGAEAEADYVLEEIKGLVHHYEFGFMRMKYAYEAFRTKCEQLEAIKPFVMANI
jgi:hypothetical protein